VEEVDAGWIVAGVQYEVAIFKFPYEDGVHDPVSHVWAAPDEEDTVAALASRTHPLPAVGRITLCWYKTQEAGEFIWRQRHRDWLRFQGYPHLSTGLFRL